MCSNELMGKVDLLLKGKKGRGTDTLWQTANKFLALQELTRLHAIRLRVSMSCAKWTFPKEPLGMWPEPGAL